MSNAQFYILLAAIVIITIAASIFGVLYFTKKTEIPDPVYIPGEKIIEKHYYTKEIIKSEPATVVNDVATQTLDSLLVFEDDSLFFKADIKYNILDSTFNNKFNFDLIQTKSFQVDTLKQYIPLDVPRELKFYEEPYFNFGLGIFVSLLLLLVGVFI